MIAFLLLNCAPESHTLLSPSDDGGASEDPPVTWSMCTVDGGRTGDTCAFDEGCSSDFPTPRGAFCHRGELLIASATHGADVEGECTGQTIEPTAIGRIEPTGRPSPGCFTARTCDRSPNITLTFCQTGPRSTLRDDAQPAFTDCASALASGRDGDACAGEYFCTATVDHGFTAWCDDGILRLGPDYPFYSL